MKKHALLFPGQLRCVDDNLFAFLDTCKTTAKIFIVTESSFKEEAEKLVARYDADVLFMEDATGFDVGIPRSEYHMIHPEFIKLEIALQHLVAWEKINNHSFEYIHRFRTDVLYPIDFNNYIKPFVDPNFNENMLLLYWCVNFSGPREAMLKLIGHPEFHVKYKKNRDFFDAITKQINIQALVNSTYAEPFVHSLPVGIVNSENDIVDFHEKIKLEFPSYIDAAESFSKRVRLEQVPDILHKCMFSRDQNLVRAYSKQWNPSFVEHIFFLHVNSLGLSTGNYSLRNPYHETPLKFSRHATTPFTVKIFNQIQAKDYTFFESDYPWEEEINLFIASKMYPGHALQKFSTIDIFAISNSACKILYNIIDLLNRPEWLILYRKDYVDSMLVRGVEPPACLQSYFSKQSI
jgi:hypothetical protein